MNEQQQNHEPPRHGVGDFDFDGWVNLAQADPAAYFSARRQVIDACIAAAPAHLTEDLRRLQNQVDFTRASCGSPMEAVRKIADLMDDHVQLLGHQLHVLKRETVRLRDKS